METNILIELLDDIDHKLKNKTYKEQRFFIGRLSGQTIQLPEKTMQKYSIKELMAMWDRKANIITELHKRGTIDDEGYKAYILSENAEFTPKLCIKTTNNQ